MRILLFDIDGTLINTGGAGGAALLAAFANEFGISEPGTVPFSGRTDRGIIGQLFSMHGLELNDANWQRISNAYLQTLPTELRRRPGMVLAGVVELLEALRQRSDVVLGLLTGNLQQGARIKLEHFQLFDAFRLGAYGDRHADRDDVARAALVEVQQHTGDEETELWVIGDTPHDVQCARAIDAKVLAVGTGIHPMDELQASRPDVLVNDLSDPMRVLETLLG